MTDTTLLWDRVSKVIVFAAVVLAVIGLSWGVYLSNQTNRLAQEIQIAQLNRKESLSEIQSLQKQVISVIDKLPAADKTLTQYAAILVLDLQVLCQGHVPACPSLPALK